MGLTKVENDVYYTCLSTDIVDNKIAGASKIGARVYVVDTGVWYVIKSDLTLGDYTIGGVGDSGPSQTITRQFTQNDDASTARDITAAPSSGKKIVATDIWISCETACYLTVQMETSNNVLAGAYVGATSLTPFTLRGMIKADAVDKKLQVKTSVACKVAVECNYYSEA